MQAKRLNPILNVSNIRESFAWFEKLGWTKGWDWGDPPTFGGVCSGECEIFLCENGQGGRGKSDVKQTFGPEGDDGADQASGCRSGWMMSTPFISTVLCKGLTSRGLRPMSRGECTRCTCGIRTGMSFESASRLSEASRIYSALKAVIGSV